MSGAAARRWSRWRPGGRGTVVIAVLVLLLAALTTGDRVAHAAVDRRIAARAECLLHSPEVTASLRAVTTLPHLATGNLGTVDLHARRAETTGVPVDVAATLRGVRTDGRVAATQETVTVPYSAALTGQKSSTSDQPALPHLDSIGGDGSNLFLHTTLAQPHLPVTVVATVTTAARRLTITPVAVTVLGRTISVDAVRPVLAHQGTALAGALDPRTVPLRQLPSWATVDTVSPERDGLAIHTHTGALTRAMGHGGGCA